MTKNILIVFLCFTLLFIAFHPASLKKSSSLYDEFDGSRQIVYLGASDFEYPIYSGDYLIDYEEVYVVNNDIPSESDMKGKLEENATLQSLNNEFYKSIYDFVTHFYENFDLYYRFNSADEHDLCSPFAIDGKIEFFYSLSEPHSLALNTIHPEYAGDFWYNITFEKYYVYDGFCWQEIDYESLNKYSDYHGYDKVLNAKNNKNDYDDIFDFGYELTIGTFEVVTSVFKGSDAFFSRFDQWKETLFGDFKLLDFLFDFIERLIDGLIGWIDTAVNKLNIFVDKLPVLGPIKRFVDKVLSPLEDVFGDLAQWIRDKL